MKIPCPDELGKGWNEAFEAFMTALPADDVLTHEQEQKLDSFLHDLPGVYDRDELFVAEVSARIFR